jgi:superfamily II DNA or RNA helicase
MQLTDYHAKYYAHELTKRCPSDSVEKLAASLIDAQVDLNPHQVEAALFAFKSPLSMGAILADEVGLGKTIEAGMVISQRWAERKRKILIIVPSSLRKQWNQELLDKFFLPSHILEARTFNAAIKRGKKNPFDHKELVICSYHFARNKAEFLVGVKWDLVIIDEAHRLRNVYKPSNKIARTLKGVLEGTPKILLTATPLQNSLLELYGLVSFIDEYAFGDIKSFRAQYTRLTNNDTYAELKARLAPICKRTLRRQVLEYIKYTNRIPITQEFIPTPEEESLYDMVSDYLRRENLQALPASQRTLMTLVLRKLLASSTFAIAGALDSLVRKLKGRLRDNDKAQAAADEELAEDYEGLEELRDEWEDGEQPEPLTQEDVETIEGEISDLEAFRDLAVSISENAKGEALISALNVGFEKAVSLGAARKAVIFTESRRTQAYLIRLLEDQGYVGKICLFNGSNSDPGSRAIYAEWKERHADSDRVTGSRTADLRSALVDFFKNQADIMIATEAAAEGINLQFCSLVVNYDLPWNPQRIEQRIGRCHRYGQQHDVVVVNFLNRKNAADQRVYELLAEKFQLFSGVFGASDEVLGVIESGVDLEKRIVAIYQNCRTTEEIQLSFDALQAELGSQIDENIQNTRQKLLENFDEEVHEKLRVNLRESRDYLNKYETMLWDLTQYALAPYAEFYEGRHAFMLKRVPFDHVTLPLGPYEMGRDIENAHIYRIGHPVAQHILKLAGDKQLDAARLVFDYTGHPVKVSILEPLVGQSGTLTLSHLTVEALDAEDYLIFAGITSDGTPLDDEQCRRLFSVPASVNGANTPGDARKRLAAAINARRKAIIEEIGARNATFFDQEMDKLDHWVGDRRATLKTNLKEMDDQIKELKKQVRHSSSLPEKIELQKKVKALDKKRDDAWREYDEAAKEIEGRKDELIDAVEARLKQNITEATLFDIEWEVR